MKEGPAGFILLELLTAMAILAILFSIATPRYVDYQRSAEAVSCQGNRRHIEVEFEIDKIGSFGPTLPVDTAVTGRMSIPSLIDWLLRPGHVWAGKPPEAADKGRKPQKLPAGKGDRSQDKSLPVIGPEWQCPSGGVYVWLTIAPETTGAPRVGCSVHYAGVQE